MVSPGAFGLGATRQSIQDQSLRRWASDLRPIRRALGWREDTSAARFLNIPQFCCPDITIINKRIQQLALTLHLKEREDFRDAWMAGRFLQKELDELLEEYGEKVWGTSQESRSAPDSALLPAGSSGYTDLFWNEPDHRKYIKLQLEHLAYGKAIYRRNNVISKKNRKSQQKKTPWSILAKAVKSNRAASTPDSTPSFTANVLGERKSARQPKRPKLFHDEDILTGDAWYKALLEAEPAEASELEAVTISRKPRTVDVSRTKPMREPCTRCRAMKIGCDKQWPCGRCVLTGSSPRECVYLSRNASRESSNAATGNVLADKAASYTTSPSRAYNLRLYSSDSPLSSVPGILDCDPENAGVHEDRENAESNEFPAENSGQSREKVMNDPPGLGRILEDEYSTRPYSLAGRPAHELSVEDDSDGDPVDADSPAQRRAHRKLLRNRAVVALQAMNMDNSVPHVGQSMVRDQEESGDTDRADSILGSTGESQPDTSEQVAEESAVEPQDQRTRSDEWQDVEQSVLGLLGHSGAKQEGTAQKEPENRELREQEEVNTSNTGETDLQDDGRDYVGTNTHGEEGQDLEPHQEDAQMREQEEGDHQAQQLEEEEVRLLTEQEHEQDQTHRHEDNNHQAQQLVEEEVQSRTEQKAAGREETPVVKTEPMEEILDKFPLSEARRRYLNKEDLDKAQYELLDLIYELSEQAEATDQSAKGLWQISKRLQNISHEIWLSEESHNRNFQLHEQHLYHALEADLDLWFSWWHHARCLGRILDYHPFEARERPSVISHNELTAASSKSGARRTFKRSLNQFHKTITERQFGDDARAEQFLVNVAFALSLFTGDRGDSENVTYTTFKEVPEEMLTYLRAPFEKLKTFELRFAFSLA